MDLNNTPALVSVLMTAYNREKYIGQAIESVLASSYRHFELIIVDDCSTDNTMAVIKEYALKEPGIKVYHNDTNLGDYPNRNKAASYAKGKYLKYLDSDDIMYPHCLQVMVTAMEQFPRAGYALSSVAEAHRPLPVCIDPRQAYLEHFAREGHFYRAPGSAIIRKTAFEDVGGFSGKRMIGDTELWFNLSRSYDMVKIPRDLVWDRTHDNQERQSEYAKKYKELTKAVIKNALSHNDCPLSAEEIHTIKKSLKKEKTRSAIKTIINRFAK